MKKKPAKPTPQTVVGQKLASETDVPSELFEAPVIQQDVPDQQSASTDLVETPEAHAARLKIESIQALRALVEALADGKPLGSVVYRFKTANGETGSNLGFFLSCKTHEIETGEPCALLEPSGPPVEVATVSGKGMQPLGSANPVKTSFCKNC